MGFRYQKRIGLGSLARINLSKSGASLSLGPRGARVTIGRTPRVTVGLPGTGLYWTETLKRGDSPLEAARADVGAVGRVQAGWLGAVTPWIIVLGLALTAWGLR
jgi:hypothetical protein